MSLGGKSVPDGFNARPSHGHTRLVDGYTLSFVAPSAHVVSPLPS